MAEGPIVPDTKDWTWVLERPCAECGFRAEEVDGPQVPALVADCAIRWERVLIRPDVTDRPVPDVWSPLEYACHVRDVFRVFDERAALMLAQDGPTFDSWDQDATALAERYAEQDPGEVAVDLAATADGAAATFASVGPDQWGRKGFRSNGSVFTVESLARYFVHDVVHHLHDVRG